MEGLGTCEEGLDPAGPPSSRPLQGRSLCQEGVGPWSDHTPSSRA